MSVASQADIAKQDRHYREVLLEPLRRCSAYRPAFGRGARSGDEDEVELNLDGFRRLYGADPLYAWVGLDSPLMYAAHKAAGGMTSIYRQLGIGCERLVRAILGDTLGLNRDQLAWHYAGVNARGREKLLTLDARIAVEDLADPAAQQRFQDWLRRTTEFLDRPPNIPVVGSIFEVRQGYKSADSKRQNADLDFGNQANLNGYLPAVMIMSSQMSEPVIRRYRAAKMLVLTGVNDKNDCISTLSFFENVVGYSIVGFFERNTGELRAEMAGILEGLLSPE